MKLSSTSNTVTPKGTTKGFISPEYFLNFFSNLYIPPLLQKSFKFPVLWLLEDTFLLMPLSKTPPKKKEITHFLQTGLSENLFFTQQKGARIMVLKKWQKLNLRGCWLQVLINSTIFATFTFLVSHVEVWRFFNILVVWRNNYMQDKTLL